MRHVIPALLFSTALVGQGEALATVQPPRVDLGVMRVGAAAETSVIVRWVHAVAAGAEAVVETPEPIELLALRTDPDEAREAVSRLTLAVATDRAGLHKETVAIRLGTELAKVEVTWNVEPAVPGGSRVLVADSPFAADSATNPATFDAWRALVKRARLDVDYRLPRKNESPFEAASLARVDVVIVGEMSLVGLSDADVARLQGFVCGGGRVVVFASAFFAMSVDGANKLCEPFGLRMLDSEPRRGPTHSARDDGLPVHPLTVGVEEIAVRRPSPTVIQDADLARPLVQLPALGIEYPFAAIATTKSGGEIVTVGTALWWDWLSQAPGNQRFLRNLLVRAPRLR